MLTQLNSTFLGIRNSSNNLISDIVKTNFKKMSSPLILQSLDPINDNDISPIVPNTRPKTTTNTTTNLCQQFESLNCVDEQIYNNSKYKSILLLDENEKFLISNEKKFIELLKIPNENKVKVVSIFGNTGEGKSHTLNHTFFNGEEIFRTSPSQTSCTLGVWAYYNNELNVICLDTEGLLGISKKEHQRTRLLLKILAVSDIIIFKTRSERLHRDMYTFLGGASKAFKDHFNNALKQVFRKNGIDKPPSILGPGLIIFHETVYTSTLNASTNVNESAEDIIRSYFTHLELSYDGFSFIKYIGCQNKDTIPTNFNQLRIAIEKELESTEIRSPRDAKYIYLTIKGLNEKFQSLITDASPQLYLPAFFTCQDKCLSCGIGCSLSMGHKDEGESHFSDKHCTLQHQYLNYIYLCKTCFNNGIKQIVQPSNLSKTDLWSSLSYAWSGYVIECPKCGKIYQSREHWYGNKEPNEEAVLIEIVHVWPGERTVFGSQNSAQKLVDGVTIISNTVASVGSQPTKMIKGWLADQIAPSYWKLNRDITECSICQTPFTPNLEIHHCRSCGEGVCEFCSTKSQPVPSRGWYEECRVCDKCFRDEPPSFNHLGDGTEIRARKIGEIVMNSLSTVKSVLEKPKEIIKRSARPLYWTPDEECINCAVCEKPFGPFLFLHHCRDCGKGVCEKCSSSLKPVPLRGWNFPVRVCDKCV